MASEEWMGNRGGDEKETDGEPRTAKHLLDYNGLVQVAELIERLRQAERNRVGAEEMTCEPEEDDYDENQATVEKSSEVKS